MKVNAVSNNQVKSPSFGHSFRVTICLKNESGLGDYFVSPSSNKKLYSTLNSKIVEWLNEDFYSNLRNVFGIERKVEKPETIGNLHKEMVKQLKGLDGDYSKFQLVRSVYNGGRLAYIVTGVDVPIVENIKGLKNIGLARADKFWSNLDDKSEYIKSLGKAISNNVLQFVGHDNVLLRSKNDKEIMLRAVFKQVGTHTTGTPKYELDRFEFHENKNKPTLKPVNKNYAQFKMSPAASDEIKKTVKYHLYKIMGKKAHFNESDITSFVDKQSK